MDIYLKFETRAKLRGHLTEGGYPKRGRNARTRRQAKESKQKTVRPYPVEKSGTAFYMKANSSYTRRKNATEITKDEAQAIGCFLDPVDDLQ